MVGKVKEYIKIMLFVAAFLLLAGAQWMHMRPEAMAAGLVFAAGAVILIACSIVEGIDLVKNRNKERG